MQSARVSGLDLLRDIAIVSVMLFHSRQLHLPFAPVARFGWMGVDLFFVLSGFLIGGQLLRPIANGTRPPLGSFYLRRLTRVIPAFAVVLALYFGFPWFREAPGMSPVWHYLTFTENYFIDYANVQAFSHVWSLCVEEHFYLVLPLLVLLLRRRASLRKTCAVLLGVLLFGVAMRMWAWRHFVTPQQLSDGDWILAWLEHVYYPTWCRLDGLLAGVSLAALSAFRPELWSRCMRHGHALTLIAIGVISSAVYIFSDRFSYAAQSSDSHSSLPASASCLWRLAATTRCSRAIEFRERRLLRASRIAYT